MLRTRTILVESFRKPDNKRTSYTCVFDYYDALLFDVREATAIDKTVQFIRKNVQPCYEKQLNWKTIILFPLLTSLNSKCQRSALVASTKDISFLTLENYKYYFSPDYWRDVGSCKLLKESLPEISSGPRKIIASYIV